MKSLLEKVNHLGVADFVVIGATVGTVGIILNVFQLGKLIVLIAVPVVFLAVALIAFTGSSVLLMAWMIKRIK